MIKEEVVKVLQKAAKEYGKTPGEKVFYESSNLNIYILHRLGWENYGELCDDAGIPRNKFDNTQYTKDQLHELFIGAIREKGKWPSRSFLDVKTFKDDSFPGSATFYKALGQVKNGDLPRSILKYVEDKPVFDDVVDICNKTLEEYSGEGKNTEARRADGGWVYLYKHGQYNQFKIGKTNDLLRRGREITIKLPEKCTLIHSIKTVDMSGVETYWLNRFRKTAEELNGEWFKLSRDDIREFRGWKRIS